MSSTMTFVYDYQMAKDIVNNICLKGSKVGKATMHNVDITFNGGYITINEGGKGKIEGILFSFVEDDFNRFKRYVGLQYKTITEKGGDVYVGKKNIKAVYFVAQSTSYIEMPEADYFEKLNVVYEEYGFDTNVLNVALAKTFIKLYPTMKKYKLIERKVENG